MLILTNLLRRLRREDGFTMLLVVGTMAVVVVAVGLVLCDVQGDFKPGRKDEDRKVAYAAAEAGIADYQARLESNPSYWAQCVDAHNPSLGQVGTKNFVSMPARAPSTQSSCSPRTASRRARRATPPAWSPAPASSASASPAGRARGTPLSSARSSRPSGPRAS